LTNKAVTCYNITLLDNSPLICYSILGVNIMPVNESLGEIKKSLDKCIGKKIRLKANGGRKKIIEKEGILENTYPSLFIIRVDETSYSQRFTFNYADVLTKTVELSLIDDSQWKLAAK